MIRESEHFYFAGRKSTDFGIRNVRVAEGLYEEPLISSKKINEIYIPGRKEAYFIDVEEEPETIQLSFGFLERWNNQLIDEITRWLDVDYYQPLYFEGNIDKVYYVIPVDGVKKIHNGLKEGYLTLNMRCDSSKAYSHNIITPTYNTTKLAKDQNKEQPLIKIGNKGHYSIFPKIWIEKVEHGDLLIYNKTNGNEEFKFTDIELGEKLFIDCKNEIIQTDKKDIYRYDNFNDNYLEIVYGENILSVSKNMKIKFSYRYEFA